MLRYWAIRPVVFTATLAAKISAPAPQRKSGRCALPPAQGDSPAQADSKAVELEQGPAQLEEMDHRGQIADTAEVGQPPRSEIQLIARIDQTMDFLEQRDPSIRGRAGFARHDPVQRRPIVGGKGHQAIGEQFAFVAKMAGEAALDESIESRGFRDHRAVQVMTQLMAESGGDDCRRMGAVEKNHELGSFTDFRAAKKSPQRQSRAA